MNYSSWFLTRLRLNRIKRLKGKIAYHEARAKALSHVYTNFDRAQSIRDGYVRNEALTAKYKAILREEEGN